MWRINKPWTLISTNVLLNHWNLKLDWHRWMESWTVVLARAAGCQSICVNFYTCTYRTAAWNINERKQLHNFQSLTWLSEEIMLKSIIFECFIYLSDWNSLVHACGCWIRANPLLPSVNNVWIQEFFDIRSPGALWVIWCIARRSY